MTDTPTTTTTPPVATGEAQPSSPPAALPADAPLGEEVKAIRGEIVKLWETITPKATGPGAVPEPKPAPEPKQSETRIETTPDVTKTAPKADKKDDDPPAKPKKRHAGLFW